MASIVRRALLATPTVYRNLARVPTISTTRLQSAQLKCTPVMSRNFCSADPKPKKDTVTITFVDRDHDRIQTTATVGQSLLDVAIDNDVDLEDIKYTTTSTGVGYGSGFELTKDTPYLALTGELWDVFCSSPLSAGDVPVAPCFRVKITFLMHDNERQEVKCKLGDNLLDVIVEEDLDIDGFGACEGTLACSTCHLIFSEENYKQLPDKPTDEELDMLDLAYGLMDTSRLGCQVIVTKDMDGWEIQVPEGVADAREP